MQRRQAPAAIQVPQLQTVEGQLPERWARRRQRGQQQAQLAGGSPKQAGVQVDGPALLCCLVYTARAASLRNLGTREEQASPGHLRRSRDRYRAGAANALRERCRMGCGSRVHC